jgi:protein transport protein SEC20
MPCSTFVSRTNAFQSYQSAFRRAQLAARQSLQKAQQLERQLLVQSYSDPKLQSDTSSVTPPTRRRAQHNTELSKDEKAINASSEVTLALRRTHDVMASELSRSQFAHDTLKESTAALSQLSETYSTLDTLLSSSKNLLGTLLRSQKSDTWYLETAFYVLLTTIAWLIFRRWLYGPLWWFVWFPLRMFFKGSAGVLTTVGVIGGASNAAGDGTSSAISHTVVHNSGTRGPKPTGGPPGKANSINVGGGGRGAPMRPRDPPQPQGEGSLSEKVGKIIDGSRSDQPGEEETLTGFTEEQKEGVEEINPKKRMWEENEVTEETSKDEL